VRDAHFLSSSPTQPRIHYPPLWVQILPFPLDARGQLEAEATLRLRSHPRVFAIGDVSLVPAESPGSTWSSSYPATAQVRRARQLFWRAGQGCHQAQTLLRLAPPGGAVAALRCLCITPLPAPHPPPPPARAHRPAALQVALQAADYAAWNVWASINGRPLLPFRYQHLGNLMSLGAANAAVALPVTLPSAVTSTLEVRA